MKREKEVLERIVRYIELLTDDIKFKYFRNIYTKELKEVFKAILKLGLNEVDFLNDFFCGKFTSKMSKVVFNKISNIESYPKDIEWAKTLTKNKKYFAKPIEILTFVWYNTQVQQKKAVK